MRLVDKPTKTLSEVQTSHMMDLLNRSKRADAKYFERMGVWKQGVRGKYIKVKQPSSHGVSVNLAYAHYRTKLPVLFYREPTVVARAEDPQNSQKADVWSHYVNLILRRNGYKKDTKDCVADSILCGEGWKKIVLFRGADSGDGAMSETNANHAADGKNIVASVWIPPSDVIVDYQAPGRDVTNSACRFVGIRYLKNLDELRADPRYDIPPVGELDAGKFAFSSQSSSQGYSKTRMNISDRILMESDTNTYQGVEDMVYIYEVWVSQLIHDGTGLKLYKQMFVLMEGCNRPIRGPIPWSDFYGSNFPGWPVHRLALNTMPGDYPIAEIESWYTLNQAINYVLSRSMDQITSGGPINLMDKSKLADPEKTIRALNRGLPRTTVTVKAGNLSEAFARIPSSPVQQDLFQILNPLIQLTERVSGSSRNRQQAVGIRTAAEVNNVEQFSQVVENEQIDTIHDFLRADVQKLVAVIKETASTEDVRNLMGYLGDVEWEAFTDDNIRWMPDIDIEVDSFRQRNQREKVQAWSVILQSALQVFPVMPNLRIDHIFYKWLEAQDIDPIPVMGDMLDQRVFQMTEIVGMMAGEPAEVTPEDHHQTHLETIRSFKNTQAYASMTPEAQGLLDQHEAEHMQANEILQESSARMTNVAQAAGQTPFDALDPAQGINTTGGANA